MLATTGDAQQLFRLALTRIRYPCPLSTRYWSMVLGAWCGWIWSIHF
jgi:hypothetical protein